MLLTSGFRLPYADPDGYEIVAPQHLQLLAERVDSALGGFDTRAGALLKRPTLVRGLSAAKGGLAGNADVIVFDTVAFDNTGGGLQISSSNYGSWQVNPAGPLSPDCYVAFGFTGSLVAETTATVGTFRDWQVMVYDYSSNTAVQVLRNHARNYETNTSGEDATICTVVRLRPKWEIQPVIRHGNGSGGYLRYGANGYAWMTYLMAVS